MHDSFDHHHVEHHNDHHHHHHHHHNHSHDRHHEHDRHRHHHNNHSHHSHHSHHSQHHDIEDPLLETSDGRRMFSLWRLILMSMFNFTIAAQGAVLLVVALPAQVLDYAGKEDKGKYLGIIVLSGALLSVLAAPLFGALSDYTRMRVIWMHKGTLLNTAGMIGMIFSENFSMLTLFYMVNRTGLWMAASPYSAFLPDLVHPTQVALGSSIMAAWTIVGYLVAGVIGLFYEDLGVRNVYWILIGTTFISLFGALLGGEMLTTPMKTLYSVAPLQSTKWSWLKDMFVPLKDHDFKWVVLTRMIVMMGVYTVQEFLQYFLKDNVPQPYDLLWGTFTFSSAPAAVSSCLLSLMAGATLASLVTGQLSDKVFGGRRKIIVYLSAPLMASVCIIDPHLDTLTDFFFVAIVYGFGFGMYLSIDWAIAAEAVPASTDNAKCFGLWNVATEFPQAIGTFIGGLILDISHSYATIFYLAAAYYVIGTLLITKVRCVR